RYAPEENDGDDAAGGKAHRVVDQAVTLDGVANLELHHRDAGQFADQIGAGEVVGDGLADLADDLAELVAFGDVRVEREHDQRQVAIQRQQLAADDLIGLHALDELLVFGPFRQLLGKQGGGYAAVLRRLPRGEDGDDAAGALDELQVGDQVAEVHQGLALEQLLPFDHDQH